MLWETLGVLALLLLVFYFHLRNAVWGGFTAGVIIGLLISTYLALTAGDFSWIVVGKAAIVGTLMGFGAELLGLVSDRLKHGASITPPAADPPAPSSP